MLNFWSSILSSWFPLARLLCSLLFFFSILFYRFLTIWIDTVKLEVRTISINHFLQHLNSTGRHTHTYTFVGLVGWFTSCLPIDLNIHIWNRLQMGFIMMLLLVLLLLLRLVHCSIHFSSCFSFGVCMEYEARMVHGVCHIILILNHTSYHRK